MPPVAPTELRVEGLTKVFRKGVKAVDDLSFDVQPGRVTGFLGPNGSGKTTTLRCLLGLVTPTSGRALVGSHAYTALPQPMSTVGASLEASGFHPGRSGRNHLRVVATTMGIADTRVDELLHLVGLTPAARRRVVEYSLGMRQRLALAAALLADPPVLILDEPTAGLDPISAAEFDELLVGLQRELALTVVMITHDLDTLFDLSTRIIVLADQRTQIDLRVPEAPSLLPPDASVLPPAAAQSEPGAGAKPTVTPTSAAHPSSPSTSRAGRP